MALCEMCGRETQLVTASVEGVEMNLCSGCSKYGSVKKRHENRIFSKKKNNKEEPQYKIVANYANLLRSAREKRDLNQEDFATFLQEKVSIVSKWESGKLKPSVSIAKRLSKLLNLKLIESDTTEVFEKKKSKKNDFFTLGDFIKVRRRK